MLSKDTLKQDLIDAMNDQRTIQSDKDLARDTMADKMATAIIKQILQLQITYLQTSLTSVSGGAVTGTFNYKLS